jgi:ornithine carbamoyltransferase
MLKHFLEIDDLDKNEILEVLRLSENTKNNKLLAQKSVALLFEKPSTRTRHSVENAILQLGGNSIYVRPEETGIDERESAQDVARTLGLYNCAIAARVFSHEKLERMASASNVPVINLLSDDTHPVQTLADLLTIKQHFGNFEDIKVAYIGDPNNVARPLAIALAMFGNKLRIAFPKGYDFHDRDVEKFKSSKVDMNIFDKAIEAATNADVIYTDAWYSMGQEDQKEKRIKDFADYQINSELMSLANKNAIFMHCLPAHRGLEATDYVLDCEQSVIWQQAENRMHTIKGLIEFLCSN